MSQSNLFTFVATSLTQTLALQFVIYAQTNTKNQEGSQEFFLFLKNILL